MGPSQTSETNRILHTTALHTRNEGWTILDALTWSEAAVLIEQQITKFSFEGLEHGAELARLRFEGPEPQVRVGQVPIQPSIGVEVTPSQSSGFEKLEFKLPFGAIQEVIDATAATLGRFERFLN